MKLALLGASGHGKVVAEIAELIGYDEVVFFDDAWPEKNKIGPWLIKGDTRTLVECKDEYGSCFVSIGNNIIRQKKQKELSQNGLPIASLIHPSAIVSRYSIIGTGVVIMAGATINAFSNIGNGCIINTGATVDHDCILGDFVHVSPGANLAGDVRVSTCSSVGIGVSIKQGITIGANSIVGAGAAVVADVPSFVVAVGVPAKIK